MKILNHTPIQSYKGFCNVAWFLVEKRSLLQEKSLSFFTQCVVVCHEERRRIRIIVVARHECCCILNVLLLGNNNRCRGNKKDEKSNERFEYRSKREHVEWSASKLYGMIVLLYSNYVCCVLGTLIF